MFIWIFHTDLTIFQITIIIICGLDSTSSLSQSEAWQGERMAHILELNKNKERIRTLEAKLMDYARTFTTTPRGQTPRKMTMDPSVIVQSRSSTILDSVAET